MSDRKSVAVVLAAGMGKRMKSDLPKVLHEVCGQSMISHVLDSLLEAGMAEIHVVVGHKGKLVQKHVEDHFNDQRIRFVTQIPQEGTAHAVRMAEPNLKDFDGDVVVCCGDAPLIRAETFRGLVEYSRNEQSRATVLSAVVDDPKGYGRVIRNTGGAVHIIEDKDCTEEQRQTHEVNAGTYCFDSSLLFQTLPKVGKDNAQEEYYLTDVLTILDKEGHKVSAVVLEDWREMIGINSRVHLAEASEILQERIQHRHMVDGVTLVDPKAIYIEKKVEIGRDSVIHPFTALRGATKIGSGCSIGPFVDLFNIQAGDNQSIPSGE